MISKLPRWVWIGAWALAFIAGMINVVGLLSFDHQAVTHLTGTTSWLGAAIASGDLPATAHFLAVIGSFLAGTVLSGFVIQDTALQLGHRYGLMLFVESLLLCAAVPALEAHHQMGLYLASCACGIQNAMMTTYSGTVVRTTHLSGMFTDLGIFLGQALRRIPFDTRRLRLCFLIISAFLSGGIVAAWIFKRLSYKTLFIPAALTGLTAISYSIYRFRRRTVVTEKPSSSAN